MISKKYLVIGLFAAVVQFAGAVPVTPGVVVTHAAEFAINMAVAPPSGPQNPHDPLRPQAPHAEIWDCHYHNCGGGDKPKVELSQSIWGTILDHLFGSLLPGARKI
jgi:hypothetical protein